jgi:hypothetical protein
LYNLCIILADRKNLNNNTYNDKVYAKQDYSTIGLKPVVLSRLQKITDEYYPGMFLPSTLIIMMNEIKRGCYKVGIHNVKLDFSGHYTS